MKFGWELTKIDFLIHHSHIPCSQPLSDDLCKVILHIAKHLCVASIQHYTGCATRSIQQVVADYRKTGAIMYIYTVLVN